MKDVFLIDINQNTIFEHTFVDCTANELCGYGAYCFQSGDQVGCACKSGFRGRTRYDTKATVCTRTYWTQTLWNLTCMQFLMPRMK